MNITRIISLGLFVTMPLCVPVQGDEVPVAIVYSLAGKASLSTPDTAARRSLRLFDRLPAGTTVEVGPGSRLSLAFWNGLRCELGERSHVTLGPTGLASRTGSVRPLPPVPPRPRISPIVEEDQAGPHAVAMRIRAKRIIPRGPSRNVAAVFRLDPIEGGRKYRIGVHDLQRNVVSAFEVIGSPPNFQSAVFRPGMPYHWIFHTLERVGSVVRGEADFPTLLAYKREALQRAVETAGDSAVTWCVPSRTLSKSPTTGAAPYLGPLGSASGRSKRESSRGTR